MSARARILVAVAAAAGVAVAATVVLAVRPQGDEQDGSGARSGSPPLVLDLGIRSDREARSLRRASALYERGRRRVAGELFAQFSSPAAQIGQAFSAWPNGTVARLEALADREPRNALVLLHLGLARWWNGDDRGAVAAWLAARDAQPDSPASLRADDLLHPNTVPLVPQFVPSFPPPTRLARLSEQAKLAMLRRDAEARSVRAKLLYGLALQRLGRQVSAERQYAAAARLAPDDAEAQVAAAVGRFSKSEPARAFGRLGPLTRRFPQAPTVRFHLGLLLAWRGQIDAAKQQFRRAQQIAPNAPLGQEAGNWVRCLDNVSACLRRTGATAR